MALPHEYTSAFDALRTQLSQLSTSLALLRSDFERSNPLPSWPSLQSSASVLGVHLSAVNSALAGHRSLLANTHAYPLPNFPGETQESLMQQLLRKKLDPRAEDWIAESLHDEERVVTAAQRHGPLTSDELDGLLKWAAPAVNHTIKPMWDSGRFDDDFTIAERKEGAKDIRTGLKRRLGRRLPEEYDGTEDDLGSDVDAGMDGDDADEDDEVMNEVQDSSNTSEELAKTNASDAPGHGISYTQPALSLDSLLRYASAGVVAR